MATGLFKLKGTRVQVFAAEEADSPLVQQQLVASGVSVGAGLVCRVPAHSPIIGFVCVCVCVCV